MTRDDEKTSEFFDQLTGKPSANGTTPNAGVTALRDALHKQIETMRAAETASNADLSADEQAKMAALRQQLIERGLIGAPSSRALPATTEGGKNWLQRLSDTLLGDNWPRLLAVSASVVFALVIILQWVQAPESDTDVVRGGDTIPELIVPEPAATVAALTAQLHNAGAVVLPVQINSQEWSLLIEVPQTVELAVVQKILSASGVQVTGPSPYRVHVKYGP